MESSKDIQFATILGDSISVVTESFGADMPEKLFFVEYHCPVKSWQH
jgi:hypothetical protein